MTEQERYKKAMSMIRPSGQMDVLNYVEERTMKHKRTVRMLATTFASFALVLLCSISAYAANIGGIRHKVNIWLHGDMTEVSIEEVSEGQFEITYPDGSVRGTGGVSIGDDGNEQWETLEEVEERLLNDPEVEKDEDGRIWLYLRDHKIDITKQIEKQGYAQEKIKDGLLADYITVVWDEDGGYSLGTDYHKFPDVEELRENTK